MESRTKLETLRQIDDIDRSTLEMDARLIEIAKNGNHSAFEELVNRYEKRLVRVIQRFVQDPDTADDLAQESFIRVFTRLEQFDPSRRFAPWLFRIGVNLAMDHHRSQRRRIWKRIIHRFDAKRNFEPTVPDPSVTQDIQHEVRRVIELIPEKYRTVLILRDLENFSSSEISAILNRKEPTIRWRLAEARLKFQELWEKAQASE